MEQLLAQQEKALQEADASLLAPAPLSSREYLQGYLAHQKLHPLGPFSRPMPQALWWP